MLLKILFDIDQQPPNLQEELSFAAYSTEGYYVDVEISDENANYTIFKLSDNVIEHILKFIGAILVVTGKQFDFFPSSLYKAKVSKIFYNWWYAENIIHFTKTLIAKKNHQYVHSKHILCTHVPQWGCHVTLCHRILLNYQIEKHICIVSIFGLLLFRATYFIAIYVWKANLF